MRGVVQYFSIIVVIVLVIEGQCAVLEHSATRDCSKHFGTYHRGGINKLRKRIIETRAVKDPRRYNIYVRTELPNWRNVQIEPEKTAPMPKIDNDEDVYESMEASIHLLGPVTALSTKVAMVIRPKMNIILLKVAQGWLQMDVNMSKEEHDRIQKMMLWVTDIQPQYPKTWHQNNLPHKYVLGSFAQEECLSIMLITVEFVDWLPSCPLFSVQHLHFNPNNKGMKDLAAIKTVNKLKEISDSLHVPIVYKNFQEDDKEEMDLLRIAMIQDNYITVFENSI
eukprot:jgi/Bigna1/145722/aug1.103_g20430